jgi:hypothetical protein
MKPECPGIVLGLFTAAWRLYVGTYSLDEVMKRWRKGELTAEQAVGQILQMIQHLSQRVGNLEHRLESQRQRSVSKTD